MAKYRKVLPHNKDQVDDLYSRGLSMRTIENIIGFSKTKVFNILHEANSPDNPIYLRHDLVANLYKKGMTPSEYADLIRARNILIKYDIEPGKTLALIQQIIEKCFRINLEPQTLVSSFNKFRQFIDSIPRKSPQSLETRLVLELRYLKQLVDNLDKKMGNCKRLRILIDTLEKSRTSPK